MWLIVLVPSVYARTTTKQGTSKEILAWLLEDCFVSFRYGGHYCTHKCECVYKRGYLFWVVSFVLYCNNSTYTTNNNDNVGMVFVHGSLTQPQWMWVCSTWEGGKNWQRTPTQREEKRVNKLILLVNLSSREGRTNLGTEAEPQQIVAQRLLSCLQYPVP
jgi:hypothetical protein